MAIRIIGTGSYLPKKVADNHFLSTIVDTDDEWIRQRTGIKERHLSNGKEGTTYMATHAAEAALENAGITADELDMIIVADSFSRYLCAKHILSGAGGHRGNPGNLF